MRLVYSFNTPHTDIIDHYCRVSNDIYNQSLYEWKKAYDADGSNMSYFALNTHMKSVHNMQGTINYYLTASHSAAYAIKTVSDSIKSFFRAIKEWKKHPEHFKAMPQFPHYRKRGGLFMLFYTPQTSVIRDGMLISKKWGVSIPIPNYDKYAERLTSYKQVRIIPMRTHCKVEIVYEYTPQQADVDADRYASIDLGIDNLVTMFTPSWTAIYSGKFLKSYNRHFNKTKAHLLSVHNLQGKKGITNRIRTMYEKRDRYLDNVYHNISRHIVNTLVSNRIGTLAVGYNQGWKQNVNIGKANNQKFLSISHARLLSMLRYKCEMVGIKMVEHEEAHTSKCDALALEPIEHHDTYLGKRIKRGLFRSSTGTLVNADQNGAMNILRKVVGDSVFKQITDSGVSLTPVTYTNSFELK